MSHTFDIVIAGAGLAGASSALACARAGMRVCILDRSAFASGASGSGAALVSPMMSRKGRPVWRVREALDILGGTDTGLLRPAGSEEQAAYFKESAEMSPDLGFWMDRDEAKARFPYLEAPFGLVRVTRGYSVDLGTLTREWIRDSVALGAVAMEHNAVESWQEGPSSVTVQMADGTDLQASRLLLATGPELVHHPQTRDLNLHPIKGQRIRLLKPKGWNASILPVSGSGFILDEGQTLSIGATFEHEWDTEGPTEAGRLELLHQAAQMIPETRDMEVLEHSAGIRVTVPGTRMPMIGPLPDSIRTWVFTGLGSKGVLMSALFGMKLPDFFNTLEAIPANCRVAIRKPIA
jgi:glycine/D-amino acid oxidase-like deaminating enzyme